MSSITDALSFIDDYISDQETQLDKTSRSVKTQGQSSSYGQSSSGIKSDVSKSTSDELSTTALGNVSEDTVSEAADTLTQQLFASATGQFDQTPNRTTENVFGSLSKTTPIAGSDSSMSLTAISGRANPLVGFYDTGSTNILKGAGGGAGDIVKQRAIKRAEQAVTNLLGFNIRKTAEAVQNAITAITTVASSIKVDFALELIKKNAQAVIVELDKKDVVIDKLQKEIIVLYNAVISVYGALPEFEKYLNDLIKAYQLIDQSNKNLKSVVSVLKSAKVYNSRLFERSLNSLIEAKALILPNDLPRNLRTNEFIDALLTRSTSSEAVAAALAIPGICQTISKLLLEYSKETVVINGLIKIFLTSLDSFISNFANNTNIDKAIIDHINAATTQLDALLKDMAVELFPTDGRDTKRTYPAEVTQMAPGWGVRLGATIEWLKKQPGRAIAGLDLTGQNAIAYRNAVNALKALNDRSGGTATLKVKEAQEEVTQVPKLIGKLMVSATTTPFNLKKSRQQVRSEFSQAKDMLKLSKSLDGDIRDILSQFIVTQNAFSKDVEKVVNSIQSVFSELGFKRGADLLKKADFTNFFKLTPTTATYAGAAAFGLGDILKTIGKSKSTTDQDYIKVSEAKNSFDRIADVQLVESVRGWGAQYDLFVAQVDEYVKSQRTLNTYVKNVASKFDDTGETSQDPATLIADLTDKAIGKSFNFNSA